MEYGPDGDTNTNTNTRNFYGEKPREIAARQVFPILVELATDSTRPTITYGDLAGEIVQYIPDGSRDQPGPRAKWIGWPLGNIWQRLFEYQQESNKEIPYLTTKETVSQGYETGPRTIPSRGVMLKIPVVPS